MSAWTSPRQLADGVRQLARRFRSGADLSAQRGNRALEQRFNFRARKLFDAADILDEEESKREVAHGVWLS